MATIENTINMRKKSTLNSREWQLYLVLKELEYEISKKEKNMKVKEWVRKKVQELEKRSGW